MTESGARNTYRRSGGVEEYRLQIQTGVGKRGSVRNKELKRVELYMWNGEPSWRKKDSFG